MSRCEMIVKPPSKIQHFSFIASQLSDSGAWWWLRAWTQRTSCQPPPARRSHGPGTWTQVSLSNNPIFFLWEKEFLVSGRLDNLLSCFVGVEALTYADSKHFCALVCNDHEEVGSISANAAGGSFLESVFERIFVGKPLSSVLTRSMFISCDNAHAVHPNYKRQHDVRHQPVLNKGPVIKVNAKHSYATTSLTSSIFKKICNSII